MAKLNLKILSPERELYSGEVKEVTISTVEGVVTILPNHLPLMSLLKPGEIVIREEKSVVPIVVSGGFVEVGVEGVCILADTAEKVAEIDEERALEAQRRATEALASKELDAREHAYFMAKLQKEIARVHVYRKHNKK